MRSGFIFYRSILYALGIHALAIGLVLGEPAPKPSPASTAEAVPVNPSAAIAPSLEKAPAPESEPSLLSDAGIQSAYLTHAPLAFFSLGSLAVGGIFYSLQNGLDRPNVGFVGGDRSSLGTAVGFAGVTALIAGVSYFYYSHRDSQSSRTWDAQVSGDVAPNGKMDVSAALVLPLPGLLP